MREEYWVAQDQLSGWRVVGGPYPDEKGAVEYVTACAPSRFKLLKTVRNIQTIVSLVEGE